MSAALAVVTPSEAWRDHTDADALALRVIEQMDRLAVKLRDIEDDIRQLRAEFAKLKKGETILGCSVWTRFCETKLNRTPRAIQYMLSGGNPNNNKPKRNNFASPEPEPQPESPARPSAVKPKNPAIDQLAEAQVRWNLRRQDCEARSAGITEMASTAVFEAGSRGSC